MWFTRTSDSLRATSARLLGEWLPPIGIKSSQREGKISRRENYCCILAAKNDVEHSVLSG